MTIGIPTPSGPEEEEEEDEEDEEDEEEEEEEEARCDEALKTSSFIG